MKNKFTKNKTGQQEIVGFILIVVLVVAALMIYLTISLRTTAKNEGSLEVSNALDAIMKQTTDCAIVYVPDYDNFEDLFKSAHQDETCSNLGISAFDYLNESLQDVLSEITKSEAAVTGYELTFSVREVGGKLWIKEGNCTSGTIKSAKRTLASGSDRLDIILKMCYI